MIRIENDVEFIHPTQKASDFGPNARPLININEVNGTLSLNNKWNIRIGKFYIENDTISTVETIKDDKGDEESHNNMFIVLSSLKSGVNKIVNIHPPF
jgi:hypothetical protein